LSIDLILIAAAFSAGLVNSVAGGGQLLAFPAMVFSGVPSVVANASSTVALFPGLFAASLAYRGHFKHLEGIPFRKALIASIAGGFVGAMLLLLTPQTTFDVVVPWLLLFASVVFIFGRSISMMFSRKLHIGVPGLMTLQFCLAVYGGYFGGGMGIVLLGVWTLLGHTDIHALNAYKTLLAGALNGAAVVLFILTGTVAWHGTLVMLVGSVIGGYFGAHTARRMNPARVRNVISVISVVVTIAFFARR
jgi:uncharacterized membrane protein YfcA